MPEWHVDRGQFGLSPGWGAAHRVLPVQGAKKAKKEESEDEVE